jgi:hypothetical protein
LPLKGQHIQTQQHTSHMLAATTAEDTPALPMLRVIAVTGYQYMPFENHSRGGTSPNNTCIAATALSPNCPCRVMPHTCIAAAREGCGRAHTL